MAYALKYFSSNHHYMYTHCFVSCSVKSGGSLVDNPGAQYPSPPSRRRTEGAVLLYCSHQPYVPAWRDWVLGPWSTGLRDREGRLKSGWPAKRGSGSRHHLHSVLTNPFHLQSFGDIKQQCPSCFSPWRSCGLGRGLRAQNLAITPLKKKTTKSPRGSLTTRR